MLKKIILISLLASSQLAISQASQANTLLELNQCAAIKDSLERLVCYDDLAKKLNGGIAVKKIPKVATPAAVSQPVQVASVPELSAEDNFGRKHLKKEKSKNEVDSIRFVVETVKKDPYDALVITFTNQQKWKQTDSDNFKLKKGDTVELQRGALGAIYLKRLDANKRIRVKRLK